MDLRIPLCGDEPFWIFSFTEIAEFAQKRLTSLKILRNTPNVAIVVSTPSLIVSTSLRHFH